MTQAVILAGGRGERLRPITDSVPKPMVPVNGLPFLGHLLLQLQRQQVERVLVLAGYLAPVISDYFQDPDSAPKGMKITVRTSAPTLSPGERILDAEMDLDSDFLLLYGDNYARFSLDELRRAQSQNSSMTVLSVFRKNPGDLRIDSAGNVTALSEKGRSNRFDFVELGYMLAQKKALLDSLRRNDGGLRLAIGEQITLGGVNSWEIQHPYFSVSDPQRLAKTSEALSKRKVLILDRDGILNVKPPKGQYVLAAREFTPIARNWEAIERLASDGYSFVVVTNQAGLATGGLRSRDLDEIHDLIRRRFENIDARLLGIYVCPHHWDSSCDCRKPRPGLLYQAAEDNSLVLDDLIMIGDQLSDWAAATAAGSRPILVGNNEDWEIKPNDWFPDIMEALPTIRHHYGEERELGFK